MVIVVDVLDYLEDNENIYSAFFSLSGSNPLIGAINGVLSVIRLSVALL